ncbi:hypothetical protein F8388_010760 [Cannabis sativa]|uniref:RNase H type-1 domain-containing protein n=1 Tax=Cannabis sativa TaxID=3483 RepID=A0A7J6HBP2_CANSA|nr:hypothetical protein F8388_010760 [Cannabis sativa]
MEDVSHALWNCPSSVKYGKAAGLWHLIKEGLCFDLSLPPGAPGQKHQMVPPPNGQLKINVGASVNGRFQGVGVGSVIRDSAGLIAASSHHYFRTPLSPLGAELCAMKVGLVLVAEMGFKNCILESDCSLEIQLIRRKDDGCSDYDPLVADVRKLLSQVNQASTSNPNDQPATASPATDLTAQCQQLISGKNGKSYSKYKKKCNICHKTTYLKRDCSKLEFTELGNSRNNRKFSNVDIADGGESEGYDRDGDMVVSNGYSGLDWVIELGCFFHICLDISQFCSHKEIESGIVKLGDNKTCLVIGIGFVKIGLP